MTARQSWPDRLAEVRRHIAHAHGSQWPDCGHGSEDQDGAVCNECERFLAPEMKELADEVERLSAEKAAIEKRNASQRRELSNYEERVKSRTMELDAMGYVWCDGGCAYGVYQKPGHEHMRPLTREMAIRAMRAAVRIGRKFGSTVEWKEMEESERVCMRAKELAIGFDRCRAETAEAEAERLSGLLAGSQFLAGERAKEIADGDARIAGLEAAVKTLHEDHANALLEATRRSLAEVVKECDAVRVEAGRLRAEKEKCTCQRIG